MSTIPKPPSGWVHTWLVPLYDWLLKVWAGLNAIIGPSFEEFRAMTAAALPSYTYDGTAKAMTAAANGALTVDDVLLKKGDSFYNNNGAAGSDQGGYVLTQQGDDNNPWIATRSDDADASGDFTKGKRIVVGPEGTTNGSTEWALTNASFTLDTTTPTLVAATGSALAGASTGESSAPDAGMTKPLNGFTGTTSGAVTTITSGGATVAAHALAGGTITDGTTETRIVDNTALTATSGTITTAKGLSSTITATGVAWALPTHTHTQT